MKNINTQTNSPELKGIFDSLNAAFVEQKYLKISDPQSQMIFDILKNVSVENIFNKANEIAEKLDVSRPVVTRTLQGLQQAGLIRISGNKDDARAKEVSLTPLGESKLGEVLPGYFGILHDAMPNSEARQ